MSVGMDRQQLHMGTIQAHSLPISPIHGSCSAPPVQPPSARRNSFSARFSRAPECLGKVESRFALAPRCSPCPVVFHTQSLDEFLLYGAADKMTQEQLSVKRNLLQTIPCSSSEHLPFSSSPSKSGKTQLNWQGLSELGFVFQGQQIQELNETQQLMKQRRQKCKPER